jgi:hypothetical protein
MIDLQEAGDVAIVVGDLGIEDTILVEEMQRGAIQPLPHCLICHPTRV